MAATFGPKIITRASVILPQMIRGNFWGGLEADERTRHRPLAKGPKAARRARRSARRGRVASKLAAPPLHEPSHRAPNAGEGRIGSRARRLRGLLPVLGRPSPDRSPLRDAFPPEPRDRLRIGL